MKEKLIILGHENPDVDSIVSGVLLERIYKKLGKNVEFVIPDAKIDEESSSICMEYGVNPYQYQKEIVPNLNNKFILVDHHERDILGSIVQVFDHHPTNKEIEGVLSYDNVNASSTSCIIGQKYENLLDQKEIELACLGAVVDTASFHSTKTRKSDQQWVLNMCKKHHLNYDHLYKTGLCLTSLSNLKQIGFNGLKKYNYNGYLVESSYIQIENIDKIWKEIYEIIDNLSNYLIDKGLDMFVFIIHDMTEFKTTVFRIDQNGWIRDRYDQYTSRGNTIMPQVEKMFERSKKIKLHSKK